MQAKMMYIAQQLQMKPEDLSKFTTQKAIQAVYQRRLIYDMNKSQLDIFDNLMIFPKNHTHTVKEKKEVLIMFIESNPKFKDISYVHIWFRIAEVCLRTKTRIKVPYIPFAPASKGRIPTCNHFF